MSDDPIITVFIADDHQLVIDGLKLMLSQAPDLQFVGAAPNGREVLRQMERQTVDVLLLDINMPELNGLETCRLMQEKFPAVKIIALSMLQEAGMIRQMLKNGAMGYLHKNAGQEEVLEAIRVVHRGEKFYSEAVKEIVLDSLAGPDKRRQAANPFPRLSRREKQVLALIVEEFTTQEIADRLHISFGTVETHRRNLLIKLGARNTAGLVRACLEYQLLDDSND